MSSKPQPAINPQTAESFNGKAVLRAVKALLSADHTLSQQLLAVFEGLVTSDSWERGVSRPGDLKISARYFSGSLKESLEIPGDLVLIRRDDDNYVLLRWVEQRWQCLDAKGEPLTTNVNVDSDEDVEAVVMAIPRKGNVSRRFGALSALWPELRMAWAEVGIASLFVNSGQLLLPVFALLIYDKVAMNGLFETLWALVLGMVLYLLIDAAMRLIRTWTTERISVNQALRSDEKLWSRMVAQTDLAPGGFPRFLSNYRDLAQSRDFVSSSYLLSVADIPFLFLYLGVIGIIAWQMMIVSLALVIIYAGIGFIFHNRQTGISKEAEQKNTLKLAYMGETLNTLDVVRTTPGSGSFLKSWRKIAEQSTRYDTQRRLAAHQAMMFTSSMQTITTVVVLAAGVYLIYAQYMSIGKLIACNILAGRAMAQVASLFTVIGKWQDFMRAAERMEESLVDVKDRVFTPRPDIEGRIAAIGLGKHYEDRPPALENISLNFAPGERVALLGRPGAGKSTLLRCLGGLSSPDVGQILIDGLALEDISRYDRVKWMVYKGQDPAVFAGTLEENLRVSGCRDQQRFREAIWASGLENEIQSGRMTLGMTLEERGNNLSGGQRQKVALARAFAQPSRILLLDEPTLGLDPESERMLAERLPKLLKKTDVLIMTTHSPIMLKLVQRVVALDGGKVVADGPRDKLVSLGPSKQRETEKAPQTA